MHNNKKICHLKSVTESVMIDEMSQKAVSMVTNIVYNNLNFCNQIQKVVNWSYHEKEDWSENVTIIMYWLTYSSVFYFLD